MSDDVIKKKAVVEWSPHPMPGAGGPAGPSPQAREQLIALGAWKSEAVNHGIVQKRPWPPSEPPPIQASPSEYDPTSPASGVPEQLSFGDQSVGHERRPESDAQFVAPTPSPQARRHADASRGAGPTPSMSSENFEPSAAPTPMPGRRQASANVAPTPVPARRRKQVSVGPTPSRQSRRHSDADSGVSPTPSIHAENFGDDVGPTLTPTPPRRQRHTDANVKEITRRRADATTTAALQSARFSRRRNSAPAGTVQSPRSPAMHEAEGRVRRTLRISPDVDHHLHQLAALLGLDLNGALSVAIVEHHVFLLSKARG